MLILLPSSTNNILAEWQGPYPITRRVGKVNYEVKIAGQRKQKRVLHVNMLQEWHAPTAIACWAEDITEHTEEDEEPVSYFDTEEQNYCVHLITSGTNLSR